MGEHERLDLLSVLESLKLDAQWDRFVVDDKRQFPLDLREPLLPQGVHRLLHLLKLLLLLVLRRLGSLALRLYLFSSLVALLDRQLQELLENLLLAPLQVSQGLRIVLIVPLILEDVVRWFDSVTLEHH